MLAPRTLALAARAALALLLFVIARPLVRRPLWAALPGLFVLVGLDDAPVRCRDGAEAAVAAVDF